MIETIIQTEIVAIHQAGYGDAVAVFFDGTMQTDIAH
jgi:hypothetical protein